MLAVEKVSKRYGPRVLFEDVSFRLLAGDRIGLVGPNGAGKTTLFGMILDQVEPDEGEVQIERNAQIGFLPQESAPIGDETVLQLASSISPEIASLYQDLHRCPDPADPTHLDAQARLTELGIHQIEVEAKKVLSGLAFRESDFERPARELSGGWVMRAHLAKLLVMDPEVLLLDEPTNHLDLETLGWFQQRVQKVRGTLLVISHDRAFLNAICSGILEIRHRRVHKYTGNYDAFLAERAAREEQHRARYEAQQREIEHIETFINRFRAKNTKATQVQSRIKQLEKMERIPPPESAEATIRFSFPQPPKSVQRVMTLRDVTQAYGDHVVYRGLDLEIEKGQRTVLVGPNGAGKSTLLKILADLVPLQGGSRTPGANIDIGYFSQQRTEVLDVQKTVLNEALSVGSGLPEVEVRKLLGAFLFCGDDAFKKVQVLSGGEKSRLALVKLLLKPPNFLLLDEPTTHLDIASIDALISALKDYPGTLMFVSHDVHFIRALASSVLHIHSGQVTPYAGDYDYYLYKTGATSERSALVAGLSDSRPDAAPRSPSVNGSGVNPKERRKEQARNQAERRKLRARVAELEREVIALEERQQEIAHALADPDVYTRTERAMALNQEAEELTRKLHETTAEWEQQAEVLLASEQN